jgi:endo-1,3(4)-beta-glucanase
MMIYVVHNLARNPQLAARGLQKLKEAFAVFVENRQRSPLV